jgi:optic atrophy protein 1
MTDKERFVRLQDEVMATQLKYQKELEKLEKENKELKKQLLLQREKLHGSKIRKIKVRPAPKRHPDQCSFDFRFSVHSRNP